MWAGCINNMISSWIYNLSKWSMIMLVKALGARYAEVCEPPCPSWYMTYT